MNPKVPRPTGVSHSRLWTPGREFALCAFLIAWMLVLPFGHVTGLRNSCAVISIVLALGIYNLPVLRQIPAGGWIAAYAVWCLVSFLWSSDRPVTLSKLQTDLILPLLGYAAGYLYARLSKNPFTLAAPLLIALGMLAAMSAIAWFKVLPFDPIIPEIPISGVPRLMPIWYPGLGDASMFATLCVGPLLWWSTASRAGAVQRSLVVLVLFGVVVEVSGNRNAFAVAPIAGGLFWIVWLIGSIHSPVGTSLAARSGLDGRAWGTILAIVLGAGLVATCALEVASRMNMERSGKQVPPWGHAAIQLFHADARADFWRQYEQLALKNRWVGVGYGRTVPAIAYGLHANPTFSPKDPAGRTHAHNVFLDTWLQTGYVGLVLLVGVLASLLHAVVRNVRSAPGDPAMGAAIVTLIVATILHNLTDDFLVYGMADGFWILLGLMFGFLARKVSMGSAQLATATAMALTA